MQITAPKKRKFWLGIIISLLCLGGMFWLIRPSEIAQAIQKTNPYFLLWTAFYLIVYLLIRAVRWRFLLGNRIKQGKLFHIQNIGQMLTQLLPFRLGDVVRAMLVGQQPGLSVPQGVTTMVVERLLDMLLMVLLLPLALLQVELTLLTWLPVVLAYNAALTAVQLPASYLDATFLMMVGAFAVAAPSSPSQVGVFHMGVIAAITALGQPGDTAASLAVLYHAINFLVMVLLGVVGLFVVNVSFQRLTSSLGLGFGLRATKLYEIGKVF